MKWNKGMPWWMRGAGRIKERPRCRRAILQLKLHPFLDQGEWNGVTAVDPEGKRLHLSDGLKKQMRRMAAAESCWPELGWRWRQ